MKDMFVKRHALVVYLFIVTPWMLSAQTVWTRSNGTVTFSKAAFADWKQASNQDRISDSVWITRANTQSIFNIRKDTSYAANAPSGTLWAFGTTDSFSTLSYLNFLPLSGNSPQSLIGKDLVLHLTAENIYLDVKILTYSGGNTGGAFSYTRSVKPGATSVDNERAAPARFSLDQNYPNPFNPTTAIGFTLEKSGMTTLKVYDIVGREVATLVNGPRDAGVHHQARFDASRFASGIYFARLQSGGKTMLKKMMLVK